jgi:hypothetical protein
VFSEKIHQAQAAAQKAKKSLAKQKTSKATAVCIQIN